MINRDPTPGDTRWLLLWVEYPEGVTMSDEGELFSIDPNNTEEDWAIDSYEDHEAHEKTKHQAVASARRIMKNRRDNMPWFCVRLIPRIAVTLYDSTIWVANPDWDGFILHVDNSTELIVKEGVNYV